MYKVSYYRNGNLCHRQYVYTEHLRDTDIQNFLWSAFRDSRIKCDGIAIQELISSYDKNIDRHTFTDDNGNDHLFTVSKE